MRIVFQPEKYFLIPEFIIRFCANQWCAGAIVRYGVVVKAAPKVRKTVGMTVKEARAWGMKRNAVVGFILPKEFIHDVQEVAD